MESSGRGRHVDSSGSRPTTSAAAKKPRKKKAQPSQRAQPTSNHPIPEPYLALAPSPLTSYPPPNAVPINSQLILPSSYLRSSTPNNNVYSSSGIGSSSTLTLPTPAPIIYPTSSSGVGTRGGYAAGLLSPPSIMPGGQSLPPRIQGDNPQTIQHARKKSAERVGVGGRLGIATAANASTTSLGVLGQILESDPVPEEGEVPQRRRRRRIVRGDTGLRRRLTVSSREEGAAVGLARGASMRRLNVWDDLPEPGDAPPPFPFPTTSSNALPPTFEAAVPSSPSIPPVLTTSDPPRSPPPTWEQAIATTPAPTSVPAQLPEPEQEPVPAPELIIESPGSPASSHYASAPSSPVETVLTLDEDDEDERNDRRLWNADLLAGYSLEDRVRREIARAKGRVKTVVEAEPSEEAGVELVPKEASEVEERSTTLAPSPLNIALESSSGPPAVIPSVENAAPPIVSVEVAAPMQSPAPLDVIAPQGPPSPRFSSPPTPVDVIQPEEPPSEPETAIPPTPPVPVVVEEKTITPPSAISQSPPSLPNPDPIAPSSAVGKSPAMPLQIKTTTQPSTTPTQPLFSSSGFAFPISTSPISPNIASFSPEIDVIPRYERELSTRPRIKHSKTSPISPIVSRKTTLESPRPDTHRRLGSEPSLPSLPPSREAALKRRELLIPRQKDEPRPELRPTKSFIDDRPASGPLIDFTDFDWPSETHHELPALAASTSELLRLLELDEGVAESSAQAVERAKLVEEIQAEMKPPHHSGITFGGKRKPPPPPPLPKLRLGENQKRSVTSTANSPITPQPMTSTSTTSSTSPTALLRLRPPSIPTRRPPPIPPRPSETTQPIPSQPPPPPFQPRPAQLRAHSSFSAKSETSSISERTIHPPKPKPGMTRPKGPRPPPPPPLMKQWSKIVVDDTSRTLQESHSDNTISERTEPEIEYTDLDVLVSRLEGSGREYEGFTQIANFLGPSKSPAATPAEISSLLPGLITIDSKRTTPQGKTKLKLSLLGVRVSKCPICLSNFRAGEMGVVLPVCGHFAHERCGLKWFKEDNRCFVCREGLGLEEKVVDIGNDESAGERLEGNVERLSEGVI